MTDTDAIPLNDDTAPDPRVVSLIRYAKEVHKREANERDARRQPEPPEAA